MLARANVSAMNGPGWRALLAPLATVAAVLSGGCSLILDFSELADAGATSDSADSCAAFEPNDTRAEAVLVEDGGNSAAICLQTPPDLDFFRFTTPGEQDVVIRLAMPDGTGPLNLNMRLYAGSDTPIAESNQEGEEDLIERIADGDGQLAAGDYEVEVFGVAPGNINEYTLTVTLTTP
jgi:hypothetical protein